MATIQSKHRTIYHKCASKLPSELSQHEIPPHSIRGCKEKYPNFQSVSFVWFSLNYLGSFPLIVRKYIQVECLHPMLHDKGYVDSFSYVVFIQKTQRNTES